jgi:hypothetical protein
MSPTLMPTRNWIQLSAGTPVLHSRMPLDVDRAAHGINDADELDQHSVNGSNGSQIPTQI